MDEVTQIAQLLKQTLSPDNNTVRVATDSLDCLSINPNFPFYLLSIATGGESQGLGISAAAYLKNFTRCNIENDPASSKVSKEFKDQLIQALLQVEPSVLRILVEVFRAIAVAEFVKKNSWPELVHNLRSAIHNSNLVNNSNSKWNTLNALTILHALLRPFQYFLNPKVAKEPVPPQLELIANELLVPLLALFHQLVKKALATHDGADIEMEKILLIICKCLHFSKLDFLSERILSLGFDVISHILETGPGWRLVSQHFMTLLDSAIFPALVMNEKDMSQWEEDAEEYLRKNLPSDMDEISGWRDDLFTARKSAMNLLGVISMSKGPPLSMSSDCLSASSKRKKGDKNKKSNQHRSMGELLVLPFLSKFPIPSDDNWSQCKILNE